MNGPAGNYYDKFNTKNPIAKRLVAGFREFFRTYYGKLPSGLRVLEVGCGEGYILEMAKERSPTSIHGFDVDMPILRQARERIPVAKISLADARNIPYGDRSFDLVICCEVLEHIDRPEDALRELKRVSAGYLIVSVPHEPIWRVLNLVRGKYLSDLGNTPGHVNHWSSNDFADLISRYFTVRAIRRPLPWTMILAQNP